jgi:hypothetical protein
MEIENLEIENSEINKINKSSFNTKTRLPIYMQHSELQHLKWIAFLNREENIEYMLVNQLTKENQRDIIHSTLQLNNILSDLKESGWILDKLPGINMISEGKVINSIQL